MIEIQILFNIANKLKSVYILKGVNKNGNFVKYFQNKDGNQKTKA